MNDDGTYKNELDRMRSNARAELMYEYLSTHMQKKCEEIQQDLINNPLKSMHRFSLSSEISTKENAMLYNGLHVIASITMFSIAMMCIGVHSFQLLYWLPLFIPCFLFWMKMMQLLIVRRRCNKFEQLSKELENEFSRRVGVECIIDSCGTHEIVVFLND